MGSKSKSVLNFIGTALENLVLVAAFFALMVTAAYIIAKQLPKAVVNNRQPAIVVTPIQHPVGQGPQLSIMPIQADAPQPEVITISEDNSVVFDQAFDENSVGTAMRQLQALSDKLPKSAEITLILYSPGGSVAAGQKLIAFCKALPQKVRTLTLFAASMGFQTVQGIPGERLIIEGGTLMSHPASFGVSGQTPYQVKSRLNWIMQMVDSLDRTAAKRMGLSFAAYQDLIHDELWVFDDKAVEVRAADRKVLAACGKYKEATKWVDVETFFGTFQVELPSCPLIPGYLGIRAKEGTTATADALRYVKLMVSDRTQFTKDYILTNKYLEFQGE